MKRTLMLGALAAALAAPLGARTTGPRPVVATVDDAIQEPVEDPKKDEITIWVMEAKGKG